MRTAETKFSGWQGICLIAITYVYFLIFAQFAFLKRLAVLGIADQHLKAVMTAMALGGIAFSLLTPRLQVFPSPQWRLRAGLTACGAASALSVLPLGLFSAIAVSLLIGCGLGLLTVTLVTWLRLWLGSTNALLKVGVGTGLGYLFCNLPPFFTASPKIQALIPTALCVAGVLITLAPVDAPPDDAYVTPTSDLSLARVLACFTALVWLDSAAFFIIQNTPELKAGTWAGSVHLWVNGFVHLAAAIASAIWLRRRGLSFVFSAAFLAFAAACLLLLNPTRALFASALYPAGVSLYSVALVAYPSLLAPARSVAERGRRAGWIYAVAGWFGSAMGIGMGQNLGQVPPAFVLVAGAVILLPVLNGLIRGRRRELALVAFVLITACLIVRLTAHSVNFIPTAGERGRQVYISEGCINCHSQYVRPNTTDEVMWGPSMPMAELRREQPPLIGNRRQGPDLAEVGSRRSALWFRAHLYNPSELSHGSFMPSYAYLFRDRRGEDLILYLESLRSSDLSAHLAKEEAWSPSPSAENHHGEELFLAYCSTCHLKSGATRNLWGPNFRRLPPDLRTGRFVHLLLSTSQGETTKRIAKIAKFGIHGTDMPGREYLPDQQISSISTWVAQNMSGTRAAELSCGVSRQTPAESMR